ncbi:hypothetical protein DBR28_18565 [Chryseobacterium sp. HMWF028]|nr:hypothetical protein DBR28_18565 [Chryseobacterium sp. HMWF028]
MKKAALISECGQYRYQLMRIWSNEPLIMFLMLNPSTADDQNDDATIRRCIDYAKRWNYGGIIVCNLFAYRSTNPKNLLSCNDPIGKRNTSVIKWSARKVDKVICAWGNSKIVDKLLKVYPEYEPLKDVSNLRYLELSKDGTPKHPLYLKSNLMPLEFKIK